MLAVLDQPAIRACAGSLPKDRIGLLTRHFAGSELPPDLCQERSKLRPPPGRRLALDDVDDVGGEVQRDDGAATRLAGDAQARFELIGSLCHSLQAPVTRCCAVH